MATKNCQVIVSGGRVFLFVMILQSTDGCGLLSSWMNLLQGVRSRPLMPCQPVTTSPDSLLRSLARHLLCRASGDIRSHRGDLAEVVMLVNK